MKYNCLIVDDERPALKLLTAYISKMPHLNLTATCENAMEAITVLENHSIHLLFLDIHMPDLTGLDLLEVLREKPQIIMTTAYRDYAVESFALDVTDYLVKPFSLSRFAKAVNKAIDQISLKNSSHIGTIKKPDQMIESKDHFFVRTNHQLEKVVISEILYIESKREYICIYTKSRRYLINKSMNSMEENLSADVFMRVHRSYIINLAQVKKINGNLVLIGEKKIPVGATYRKRFSDRIKLL